MINVEQIKCFSISSLTQLEYDLIYAGLCCLSAEKAQKYTKENMTERDLQTIINNLTYALEVGATGKVEL